eukprot:UN29928
MEYRYLGNTGLKVSVLGFGNMTAGSPAKDKPDEQKACTEVMKAAFKAGVNFFDTAEFYGLGTAETQLGEAIKEIGAPREDFVITTKIYRCGAGVNNTFLSRKHIIEGLKASLKRMDLEYVDVVYAHRPDLETPLEETCRAFDWAINEGLAFYWG